MTLEVSFSIVLAINANGVKFLCQGSNFAQEILGSESPFPERGGGSIGRRRHPRAGCYQLSQQA